MPKTQDILQSLSSIANNYSLYAIFWHITFYLMLILLFLKWNPSNKTLGMILCLPLLSVAFFAWLSGNPFNGLLFSVISILILIFGLKGSNDQIEVSQFPFLLSGIIMIIFGLIYPHFLNTSSVFQYFYSSPVGLIPCPTLSILIGIVLIYSGLSSAPITLTFIIFGLFYSLFGVFKLGVYLDLILLFGTLSLLARYILSMRIPN